MKTTFTYTIEFIALLIVLASCNTQTFEYYKAKAEQGNAEAQYNLGRCYFEGDGIVIDKVKAVEWWQKSAEQGNAEAQYSLGRCYADGEGVTMNKVKAVEWYQKAAKQGDTALLSLRSTLLSILKSQEIQLFGVTSNADTKSVLDNLSRAGVFKVDSISHKPRYSYRHGYGDSKITDSCVCVDDGITFAIVEFGGIKFGFNPEFEISDSHVAVNYLLFTAPKSHEDFLAVKATIEKYYGETQEKDDAEFRYWWSLDNMHIYFRYLRPICNGEFVISLKYNVRQK